MSLLLVSWLLSFRHRRHYGRTTNRWIIMSLLRQGATSSSVPVRGESFLHSRSFYLARESDHRIFCTLTKASQTKEKESSFFCSNFLLARRTRRKENRTKKEEHRSRDWCAQRRADRGTWLNGSAWLYRLKSSFWESGADDKDVMTYQFAGDWFSDVGYDSWVPSPRRTLSDCFVSQSGSILFAPFCKDRKSATTW